MQIKDIYSAIKELNSKIDNLQTQFNNMQTQIDTKVDKIITVTTANTDLNDYTETGFYYFKTYL